jgi:hypothetical protein
VPVAARRLAIMNFLRLHASDGSGMTTAKRRWVPIVAGVAVLLVFLGIGAALISFAWLREHTTLERDVAASRADEAFAAAVKGFLDPRPAIEVGEDRRPRPAAGLPRRNPGQVTTLHLLAWDPGERALADVTLPMWLVRLKSGPIQFGGYVSGLDDHGVRLTAEDIERLGPGVLLDFTAPSGERVLLSAQ